MPERPGRSAFPLGWRTSRQCQDSPTTPGAYLAGARAGQSLAQAPWSRFLHMAPPIQLRDPNLFAVVILPPKPAQLAFASAGEGGGSDDGCCWLLQDVELLQFVLQRISVGVTCSLCLWDDRVSYRVLRVDDPLSFRVIVVYFITNLCPLRRTSHRVLYPTTRISSLVHRR